MIRRDKEERESKTNGREERERESESAREREREGEMLRVYLKKSKFSPTAGKNSAGRLMTGTARNVRWTDGQEGRLGMPTALNEPWMSATL